MAHTIVALATPTGRSGIGVIRLSGRDAFAIAQNVTGDGPFDPRTAHLRQIRDPETSEIIDEAIVTFFKSPNSFTGEDVVEISCHGSPVLLRHVIDICLRLGARMAEAGEFTLRALANGRMDLAEAEAIRDLIDAQTTAAARQAVRQLRGEFSDQLKPIKNELLDVIVILESALEFVEDDLPDVQTADIRRRLQSLADSLGAIASTFRAGHLIREGLKVALVGRPNVGKSSLFNALLGSDRAIVTDIAGTTRDQIHERFIINNIPVSLIDTAGLRDTTDTVESIGVERSRRAIADADLVIVILDASEPLTSEDRRILHSVKELNYLVALNKIDLVSAENRMLSAEESGPGVKATEFIESKIENLKDSKIIWLSAKSGEGLDELGRAIIQLFSLEDSATSGFLVSDARHHDLLVRARAEIEHSAELLDARASEEIILVGLHNALRYLGQITGETTTEHMLTRIFSTFCIGK